MAEAYPLSWPLGLNRAERRVNSPFKITMNKAHSMLVSEIRRLMGTNIVISSNVPLKADGSMRMDREPVDPGIAVYFTRGDKQQVFACDKYDSLRENMIALARTLEALRSIERWGSSELMERAFSGFKELPQTAGQGEDCWAVLGLRPMDEARLVTLSHRDMIRKLHAEGKGSAEFARVNVARDDAMAALAAAAKGK